MKLAITTHAVDRWRELTDPPMSWAEARVELGAALECHPERCGVTRHGQAVFRVEQPRLAFLVVKLGPDKLARAYASGTPAGIIVTVLPLELWERGLDEALELEEAMAAARTAIPAAPMLKTGETSRPPPPKVSLRQNAAHKRWEDWAWAIATIERDRRITEADLYLRNRLGDLHRVLTAARRLLEGKGTEADLAREVARFTPTEEASTTTATRNTE